jgi:PAS domain S-box-containing protein
MDKPIISIKNAFILAFITVISFAAISILLRNYDYPRLVFGDILSPIIELVVVIILFYVILYLATQELRIRRGWLFIAVALSFYVFGDILWAIYEIGLHQDPSVSLSDIFYLIFYPIFAVGIYYLTKFSFNRSEKFKIFIDMGIVMITVGLMFWTFLILPTLSSQENYNLIIISLSYILGDFLLFFVLLRLLYSKFEENYVPIIFLAAGILVLIFTDSVFAYETLQDIYVSGGLLDTGWILSFILIGLAAFLQFTQEELNFKRFSKIRLSIERSNITTYIPLIWVLIAFILLVWANQNLTTPNMEIIELGVGFIIFLVIMRQVITLNENERLYQAAEKEILNRKKAEELARESNERLKLTLDAVNEGVWDWNIPTGETVFSPSYYTMLGYEPYEFPQNYESWRSLVHPEDIEKTEQEINKHLTTGKDYSIEIRVKTKSGKWIWILTKGRVVERDKHGMPIRMVGTQSDITTRRNAENKLIESEKRFRSLIYNSTEIIRILDENGTIIFDSPSSVHILGYPEGSLVGKNPIDYIHPDDQERVKKDLNEVYDNKNTGIPTEFRIRKVDGTYLPVESTSQNLTDVPSIAGIVVTTHPIKERKEMENALRGSEEKYKMLFESDPAYTILLDREGKILEINNAAVNFTGKTREDLINKRFIELGLFPEEDKAFQKELFSKVLAGQRVKPSQYGVIDKDGIKRCVESQFIPLRQNGRVYAVMVISTDVTEKKIATDKLKASVREKEILIQEIHHRVKNNMQIISSLLNLQSRYVEDGEAVDVLKESQNRVKSMAMIHEKLYQSADLTQINFVDYIQSLVSNLLYSYDIKSDHIKPILEVDDVNLNIETAVPCGLIISELVSNSLKYAFPDGIKGEISVSLKVVDEEYELTISDNGIGLPDELDLEKIDSLGLLLVTSLTEQIDGEITIRSIKGTEFKIKFKELEYNERI